MKEQMSRKPFLVVGSSKSMRSLPIESWHHRRSRLYIYDAQGQLQRFSRHMYSSGYSATAYVIE